MIKTVALSPHVHAVLKQILDKSCLANEARKAEHVEITNLLDNIASIIFTNYSLERTPNLLRATGAGSLSGNIYSFSVYNGGAANGDVLGGVIKPGETFNFDAGGVNNFFDGSNISYDGTGTELVIIYNT
jgi:hypothetical protein